MNLWKAAQRAYATAEAHGFWTKLDERCKMVAEKNHAAAWDSDYVAGRINTKLMLIVSEVTEAMEENRRPGDERSITAFSEELADIIIRTLDLAGYLGVNLEVAVRSKMDTNEQRPMTHGGKRF